jgi:hypothetical protein
MTPTSSFLARGRGKSSTAKSATDVENALMNLDFAHAEALNNKNPPEERADRF